MSQPELNLLRVEPVPKQHRRAGVPKRVRSRPRNACCLRCAPPGRRSRDRVDDRRRPRRRATHPWPYRASSRVLGPVRAQAARRGVRSATSEARETNTPVHRAGCPARTAAAIVEPRCRRRERAVSTWRADRSRTVPDWVLQPSTLTVAETERSTSRGFREADDGIRTRDTWLGKPVLYQLSYVREAWILAVVGVSAVFARAPLMPKRGPVGSG
jgi:hypothetical protein